MGTTSGAPELIEMHDDNIADAHGRIVAKECVGFAHDLFLIPSRIR
jgi:hypothetical protein